MIQMQAQAIFDAIDGELERRGIVLSP